MRKEKLMNVTQTNLKLKSELDANQSESKNEKLREDQAWVNSIIEAQRTENDWQHKNKADIINDLRQNYAMQAHEKREQGAIAIKNL